MENWTLKRQDDNGNIVSICTRDDKKELERLRDEFEQRAHKQTYWVEPAAAVARAAKP